MSPAVGTVPVRAKLAIEQPGTATEPMTSAELECWFNPTTLVRRRSAAWKTDPKVAKSAQNPGYLGGEGDTVTLNLLLHVDEKRDSAQLATNLAQLLALVDPVVTVKNRQRPPRLTLNWGSITSVVMTAKGVDVTYELFDVDGTPLRARVDLSLVQFDPAPGQGSSNPGNPTTRATQARRAHEVTVGENLHLIAHHHLRDPARWSVIARANGLEDPLRIRAGDTLLIPMEDT